MSSFALRRWFQFKLRTVMVVATLLCLTLGWFATRMHRGAQQRPIVEAIEQAGGRVWVVGELDRKDPNAQRLAALNRRRLYDSQRPEIGALAQMVEDAKAGDVVCIAFWPSMMMNILDDDGSEHPQFYGQATDVYGQATDMAGGGWKLHVDSRDPWGIRARSLPVRPQPIEWSALSAFPSLQILDLGARPIGDQELKQITRLTDLRAMLAPCANITDAGLAVVAKLQKLRVLSLQKTQATDDGLRHLAGLRRLEVLELDQSAIRGEGLKHLEGLSQLKLLSLRHTPVGNEGLEHIAKLTELRRLYLYDTAVTDAGLAKLRPLKKLEILHLGKTAVTFGAANEFEKDLPRSPIIR